MSSTDFSSCLCIKSKKPIYTAASKSYERTASFQGGVFQSQAVYITPDQVFYPQNYNISSQEKQHVCNVINEIFEKWHCQYPDISPEMLRQRIVIKFGKCTPGETSTFRHHFEMDLPTRTLNGLLKRIDLQKNPHQKTLEYFLKNKEDKNFLLRSLANYLRSLTDKELEIFAKEFRSIIYNYPISDEESIGCIAHEVGHIFFNLITTPGNSIEKARLSEQFADRVADNPTFLKGLISYFKTARSLEDFITDSVGRIVAEQVSRQDYHSTYQKRIESAEFLYDQLTAIPKEPEKSALAKPKNRFFSFFGHNTICNK